MLRPVLTLLAFVLAISMPHAGFARYMRRGIPGSDVTGTVTDTAGTPLERVAWYIPELNIGGCTGPDGRYSVSGLPAGNFQMEFSLIGCRTAVRAIRSDGNPLLLDVLLEVSPIRTNEIVVTAPYATVPGRTPYEVVTASEEDLRFSGATTLTGAITHIPGVSQLSTGVGISKPVVRGLHGSRVLTVIDGFRFDNQQWQDEHGLGLSDMGIRSVEALKGPASVLYGGDAMGGVLNLVDETPAPVGRSVSDMNVRIDENTLGLNTDVGVKQSTDDYYWKIRAGGESHADYLDGRDERVPNTRFNGFSLKSNFGILRPDFSSAVNYQFSLYQFGVVEAHEAPAQPGAEEERFAREMEGPHHSVGYHLITTQNTFYAGGSRIRLDAGAHFNNRQEEEGPEDSALGNLDMQLNTLSFNARYVSPPVLGSEATVGVEGTFSSNTNSGTRVIIPDADTREISGYGFFRHQLDRLVVEEGVRFNRFHVGTVERGIVDSAGYMPALDRSYSPVNGSVGLSWNFLENFLVKGNFAMGYRAPGLAELSSNGLHEGTLNYEIGDVNLRNEENAEFDGGIHYSSAAASFDLTVFRNSFHHFIYLTPTAEIRDGYRVYRFLQSDAVIRGGEIGLNWRVPSAGRLSLRHTLSIIEGKLHDRTYLPLMPAGTMSHELRYDTDIWSVFRGGFLKLGVDISFAQNRTAAVEPRTPGYALINAEVGGYLFGSGSYGTFTATNLLGKSYFDHLSRIKPGGFSDPDAGFENIGRNFTFALHIPISG